MQDYREISEWFAKMPFDHTIETVASLPGPVFVSGGRHLVSFSTNNYLALAGSTRLVNAARRGLERYGVANCESRLLGGNLEIYDQLESKLAELKGKPSAMLFATGYLTNLGILSALPGSALMARVYGFRPKKLRKYVYFTDEFNHTSIREGIRMSGVEKVTYKHCDMNQLEAKLKASESKVKIIVSDGVFSMDGDIVPLAEMLELAERFDAIVYIDDAHGTGVLGEHGGGTTEHFGVKSERLISMGTLSKAYGAIGGFIATEAYITELLRFTCSAYGFTSTLPPDQAFAVCEAIDMVKDEPERRRNLWDNQKYFIKQMDMLGYRLLSRESAIVPVWIGDEVRCHTVAAALRQSGFHVDAVAFPGVARGQSRLRFMMNAGHTREQIDGVVTVMSELQNADLAQAGAA